MQQQTKLLNKLEPIILLQGNMCLSFSVKNQDDLDIFLHFTQWLVTILHYTLVSELLTNKHAHCFKVLVTYIIQYVQCY